MDNSVNQRVKNRDDLVDRKFGKNRVALMQPGKKTVCDFAYRLENDFASGTSAQRRVRQSETVNVRININEFRAVDNVSNGTE